MKIVVIGTGMYVSGRGTDGFGTILPAIVEWKRNSGIQDSIFLGGSSKSNTLKAMEKVKRLQSVSGVNLNVEAFDFIEETNPDAYKFVISKIEKPACAIIAVPDQIHFKITMDCLKAGLHCLVVKPLTPKVNESKKLISFAKKQNIYGAVEFHKRWDRQNKLLRDEFLNGNLGIPLYTWTEYSQRKSIPTKFFNSWVQNTNIFQYLGVHYVDIIRFVTGAVPKKVLATGQKSWLKMKGIDVYDSIQCLIEWETSKEEKFVQTILVNWIDPEESTAMSDQKIKFVGTLGRYEGDQKKRGLKLLYDNKNLEEPNPDFCRQYFDSEKKSVWEGYGIESVKTFLDDVYKIIFKKKSLNELEGKRPTFKESLYSTAVIEAANESLNNNSKWYPTIFQNSN